MRVAVPTAPVTPSEKAFFASYVVRTAPWWREGDAVVVLVDKRETAVDRWFRGLLGTPKRLRVRLDEVGSWLHELADGGRTGRELCEAAEAQFGDRVRPARESVRKHFDHLGRLRAVAFSAGPGQSLGPTFPKETACRRCGHATRLLETDVRYRCPECGTVNRAVHEDSKGLK